MTEDPLQEAIKRAEEAEKKVAEYEEAITWDTTCTSCSHWIGVSHQDHERAEKAEEKLKEAERDRDRSDRWLERDTLRADARERQLRLTIEQLKDSLPEPEWVAVMMEDGYKSLLQKTGKDIQAERDKWRLLYTKLTGRMIKLADRWEEVKEPAAEDLRQELNALDEETEEG